MQSGYATEYDPGVSMIMQILPLMIFQVLYAIVVFQICRKQNWNSWLWTLVTLVPVIGAFAFIVTFLSSHLKSLDRLNALEGKTQN